VGDLKSDPHNKKNVDSRVLFFLHGTKCECSSVLELLHSAGNPSSAKIAKPRSDEAFVVRMRLLYRDATWRFCGKEDARRRLKSNMTSQLQHE
jgi:hypothetical protein